MSASPPSSTPTPPSNPSPSPPSSSNPPPSSSSTSPPPPTSSSSPPPPSSSSSPPPPSSSSSSPPPPSSSSSPPPPSSSSSSPPPPSSSSSPPPPSSSSSPPPPTSSTSPPPPDQTPPPSTPSPPPPMTTPPPTSSTSPPPPDQTPPPSTPSPPPPSTPPPTSPPPPAKAPPPTSPPPPSAPPPKSPPPANPPPSTAPPPSIPSPPPPAASPPPPKSAPPPSTPSPPPPNTSPPPTISPPPPDGSPPPPDSSPPPPDSPPSPPSPISLTPPVTARSPPPPIRLSLSPPPPPEAPAGSKTSTALVAGVVAGVVVGLVALVAICCVLFYKRKSRKREGSTDNAGGSYYTGQIQASLMRSQPQPVSPSYPNNNLGPNRSGSNVSGPTYLPLAPSPVRPAVVGGPFTYDELSIATSGFAESNVLGQGGFGLVYKGILDGKEVAIKKLRSGGGQGEREFRAEVEIISRVHHRNLVSLVGYCIHDEQRLLVYEYVPNKTLEFHLHGSGRPTLDWVRRWKIALGAAKGFAYLHEDCDPKIIHRDIKAANILLDYNFEPKVADFGLAKLMPDDISHISTRVMGTFGYVAPEYAQSGKLTDRSDVYSYGVMLLELITGRKPLNTSAEAYNDQPLVEWARPLLSRAVSEELYDVLVDPRLELNYDQHDMTRLIHCAAASVRHLARKRPRMSQIVRYLEGEISLEDLNAGVLPGNSRAHGGVSSDQVGTLRRMAFGGIISEDLESELSEPASEFNQTHSSSSQTDTAEIEMRRSSRQYL